MGAHAQAPRRLVAHAGGTGRARQLLRRNARRARARNRPHPRGRRHMGSHRGPVGDDPPDRRQRRLVPDGQRPVTTGHPLLGATRRAGALPRPDRRRPRCPGRGRRRARHRGTRRARLGRRGAPAARGAQQLLAGRVDRDGGELSLRRAETIETKIFARLSAWQNWIFQRPNAVGAEGALRRFGSGSRPTYDRRRV